MDSINRKHNDGRRRALVVTSDDRNGVVVNRAKDSTRGIPICLVEERCIQVRKAVRKFMRKVSTRPYYAAVVPVRPKSGFLRSFTALPVRTSQPIGWQLQPVCESQQQSQSSRWHCQQHVRSFSTVPRRSRLYETSTKQECRLYDNRSECRVVTSRWH